MLKTQKRTRQSQSSNSGNINHHHLLFKGEGWGQLRAGGGAFWEYRKAPATAKKPYVRWVMERNRDGRVNDKLGIHKGDQGKRAARCEKVWGGDPGRGKAGKGGNRAVWDPFSVGHTMCLCVACHTYARERAHAQRHIKIGRVHARREYKGPLTLSRMHTHTPCRSKRNAPRPSGVHTPKNCCVFWFCWYSIKRTTL